MKTIIVPTDLSLAAKNAARYAVQIAKVISADIKLCNAIKIPAEAYMAGTVAWPLEDYDILKADTDKELEKLAHHLTEHINETTADHSFHPKITYTCTIGEVTDMVRNMAADEHCPLVVMGMSGAGGLSRFFFGSSTRDMINVAEFPLLLIPANYTYNGIRKIAFATDLNEKDIQIIYSLSSFAKHFNAELLISHVTDEKYESDTKKRIDDFLKEVTDKVNYDKVYYRHVKAFDIDHGLDWMYEHGAISMLAMSHAQHGIINEILNVSYTQKLARHIDIPLLVYPKQDCSAALVNF